MVENSHAGTPGWNLDAAPPTTTLDGYTSEVSTIPGGAIHLHVTGARGERYRIEVYRLGWYGGVGARLMQCIPSCSGDEAAAAQPVTPPPASNGYLDAGWPVTDVVSVATSWVSGEYEAKLVITAGRNVRSARFVPFVVYEPAPQSPIVVQVPVNTWEAYNGWGGKSLYSPGGVYISFNRPYAGPNPPMQWEYQLIRFLESRGYWVSYATDLETALGLDALSSRRLVMVAGHDEYWTKEMRDAFDAAQASGTNMAFMGANAGYWQMRYADNYRSILEYRSAAADPNPNPATKTTRYRQLVPPRPECWLEGIQFGAGGSSPPVRSYQVAPGALSNPWFAGTGFTQSTVLTGLVGYEWDTAGQAGCPQVQRLFTWSGPDAHGHHSEADAATFTASSGARVFDAGSFQFSWGLDGYLHSGHVSPQLQAFTQNMLNDL